jgi:hypothetical protein
VFLRANSAYSAKLLNDQFKYLPDLIDIPENAATMRRSSSSDGERNKAPEQVNRQFESIYQISTKGGCNGASKAYNAPPRSGRSGLNYRP